MYKSHHQIAILRWMLNKRQFYNQNMKVKSSLLWIAIHNRLYCNRNMKANSHAKTLNPIAIVIANASLSIALNCWVNCLTQSTVCKFPNSNRIFKSFVKKKRFLKFLNVNISNTYFTVMIQKITGLFSTFDKIMLCFSPSVQKCWGFLHLGSIIAIWLFFS